MELRHLRYFVTVAEELHFGRAASRLHMAQPPLSQQIKRLERELGVQLFERTRRKVELTLTGELLLAEARRALAQADRVLDLARDVRTGEAGRVRIGFVGSALYGPLPALLQALRRQAPKITLSILEMETGPQVTGLVNDELDLGFMRPPPEAVPPLAVRVLLSEELVAALPQQHPHPEGEPVPLAALATEPFVLFPASHGHGFWDVVMRACASAGFVPHIVYEAEHVHTMAGMVASGLGVSLLPASMRRLSLDGLRYEDIEGDAPLLPLALAWDPRRPFPALERVIEIITSEVRACQCRPSPPHPAGPGTAR